MYCMHPWITLPKTESDDSEEGVTPETVDITVTVLDDSDDDPIEGAIVTIGDVTCSNGTGSAGGCTLRDVAVGTGVSVSVTAEGYTSYSDTADITSETTSMTIKLTAS